MRIKAKNRQASFTTKDQMGKRLTHLHRWHIEKQRGGLIAGDALIGEGADAKPISSGRRVSAGVHELRAPTTYA